jgi:hypothetical protein
MKPMSKKEDEAFDAAWNTPPAFGSGFAKMAVWILLGLFAWMFFGPLLHSNTFNNQNSNSSHSYYHHSHHHSHGD